MYKIKPGFALRQVVQDYIVTPVGENAVDFSSVIVLNEVGTRVYQLLEEGKQVNEMAQIIAAEYEIDVNTATEDVVVFLNKLVKDGVCERV